MSAVKAHFSRNQQLRLHVCRIEMETFMPRSTVLPVKSSSVKPRNTLSYCQIGNLGARNKSRQPGDHRMQRFVLLFTAALLSLTFATNKPAEAAAVSGPGILSSLQATGTATDLVQKSHGWHCSVRRGYVPSLGYRALHRHPRACRRRGRCYNRYRTCRRRWGYGWRYRRCMRRSGCY